VKVTGDVAVQEVAVDPDGLRAFIASVLGDLGFDDEQAGIGAEVLVRTDLRGHHTHGTRFLPIYVPLMRGGAIRTDAKLETVRETVSTAVLDAKDGMGHVMMYQATEFAIDKTRSTGSGCTTVLVRESNHFGAADLYSLMIAEAGYIGIVLTNSVPVMAAPGSRGQIISNAPFSYGVPVKNGQHMVLDMALSETAGSRVAMAAERGESIPEGWVLDGEGLPTTDPNAFLEGGALQGIGNHKGWAIALLTETLSGVLSGAGILSEVLRYRNFPETPTRTGHTIIVLDPEAFMSREEFDARMRQMIDEIHGAPTAPGVARVSVPGEPELEHERASLENGLELDAYTWETLAKTAEEFGRMSELTAARLDAVSAGGES
jgi:LDH2 family malate/lactate/ureidoglycolate dehydrogenase